MSNGREVLITSEASGQLWNACIWDPQSGCSLMTLKGGSSAPRTLNLLNNNYLVAALTHKPIIQIWAIQRKEQLQQSMVCPGRLMALAFSPDDQYAVAALAEKIHVWQVSTGHLLAVLTRHYQPVRFLGFTDDGSHFVSAGDDNFVAVWAMSSVLAACQGQFQTNAAEPRWLWCSHSLPITDVHIGVGGIQARVASVSLDQTCRVWDLGSGELLCTVLFDSGLTSVTMDNMESRLFAGSATGVIYPVNLLERPIQKEHHVTQTQEGSVTFTGHSKQVTCLAVSMDGTVLASGSHDATVKLWDILSRQCIRTLQHKGAVMNLLLVPTPRGLLSSLNQPGLPIPQFQRRLFTETDVKHHAIIVRPGKRKIQENSTQDDHLLSECFQTLTKKTNDGSTIEMAEKLQNKVASLSQINRDIFDFSVKQILNSTNKDL